MQDTPTSMPELSLSCSPSCPTSTVRLRNLLINKEKLRFEADCGAKRRICAILLFYNRLNWLGFSPLMSLLAPQQPQNSDFPSDFNELLNRTVEVGSALPADRGDAADAGAAEGLRSAGACGVAISGRLKRHFIQCRQWFM